MARPIDRERVLAEARAKRAKHERLAAESPDKRKRQRERHDKWKEGRDGQASL